jgi:hypothetical protein
MRGRQQTHKHDIYLFTVYFTVLYVAQIIQPSSGRMITEKFIGKDGEPGTS